MRQTVQEVLRLSFLSVRTDAAQPIKSVIYDSDDGSEGGSAAAIKSSSIKILILQFRVAVIKL